MAHLNIEMRDLTVSSEVQLPAHNQCIPLIPQVITDGVIFILITDLHSAFLLTRSGHTAIHQQDITILTACITQFLVPM
jgi:hypothetical protein